jgi:hypothetical protein
MEREKQETEQLLQEKEQEKQEKKEQLLAQSAKFETAQREGGEAILQEQRAASSAQPRWCFFFTVEAVMGV